MNIAVIGSTGKLGNIITEKLLENGYTPTAIVRDHRKVTIGVPVIEKNIFDLTTEDISAFDVVISAFGAPMDDLNQFTTTTQHFIKIFKDTDTRLIVAGGAGGLYVADGVRLIDTDNIPPQFVPLAEAEVAAFELLAAEQRFAWTYMAPPAVMEYGVPERGNFVLSGDKLGFNAKGESYTTYVDYANAFIEVLSKPFNHETVGVYSN